MFLQSLTNQGVSFTTNLPVTVSCAHPAPVPSKPLLMTVSTLSCASFKVSTCVRGVESMNGWMDKWKARYSVTRASSSSAHDTSSNYDSKIFVCQTTIRLVIPRELRFANYNCQKYFLLAHNPSYNSVPRRVLIE